MYFVGVDLAWGSRGTTGLAVAGEDGQVLDITTRQTDDDILAWLRPWTEGPCFVAFDAPLIVVNPTGHRLCERLVSRYFGRYGASCHAANTANPSFSEGSRALRLATALGLSTDPGSPRHAAEVYPHPALVTLFELPRVLQYKAKPGRDFAQLRGEMLRLVTYLESLAAADPPLVLKSSPQWERIRDGLESAARKADLKRLEDAIDGVVCAYIAAYATARPTDVRTLGDPADGTILVPVDPDLATRIDQEPLG
ncbi:putative RNase H-like nuclease [Kribbella amoyensis]|uniref:Putative RNase H-like nuclease n=1 Tax=Kribbella amoyensis TaxID=996641 RepID=A0A561B2I9_9ACTN|nr:DUF429 domain-containing protein [Kribbella amoyensis]TWD73076.1 putative RNase H-like nuclease [Kribbella amoyensis]